MNFEEAVRTDPTVYSMVKQSMLGRCGYEDIIAALATEKQAMMKRIQELESIAPRKMIFPDGRLGVWRCPDDMIPYSDQKYEF